MTYDTSTKNVKKICVKTIRLDEDIYEKIKKSASKQGIDFTKWIRKACETQLMMDEEFPDICTIIEEQENMDSSTLEKQTEFQKCLERILDDKIIDFENRIKKMIDDFEKRNPEIKK